MRIEEDKIRSSCPIVRETGGKVWFKQAETFHLFELEEFLSISVVAVMSEGCVLCVEVSKNINWRVGVVKKGVKDCEGEPSVMTTVCCGNKKGSMLSVNLVC